MRGPLEKSIRQRTLKAIRIIADRTIRVIACRSCSPASRRFYCAPCTTRLFSFLSLQAHVHILLSFFLFPFPVPFALSFLPFAARRRVYTITRQEKAPRCYEHSLATLAPATHTWRQGGRGLAGRDVRAGVQNNGPPFTRFPPEIARASLIQILNNA